MDKKRIVRIDNIEVLTKTNDCSSLETIKFTWSGSEGVGEYELEWDGKELSAYSGDMDTPECKDFLIDLLSSLADMAKIED